MILFGIAFGYVEAAVVVYLRTIFVPVPWVGPVLAPVLVSLSMILSGEAILWCEATDRPLRLRGLHWVSIFVGGLTVIVAFCWDWRHVAAGGWPHPFHWPLLALGEAIGTAGFLHALLGRRPRKSGDQP